ncbi:MAG: flavin reductase [Clostridia bacterium]|nr:flavin reductase [Clostridia bacterium]
MDPQTFRKVLGRFATGVTVVTATGDRGAHGMTVNAFSSVSLEPPLVLVCLDHRSETCGVVRDTGRFAISILGQKQRPVSDFFAQKGDKTGFPFRTGPAGLPLVEEALAYLECRVVAAHEAGDHTIFVGEVVDGAVEDEDDLPLIFFASRYRRLAEGEL